MNPKGRNTLAGIMIAVLPVVHAEAADNWDTCAKASGDVAIAACTQAIGSGQYKGHNLAVAYYNRGIEWGAKGNTDRAIADFDEAIRIDPKYAPAYYNRGTAWDAKGDHDRAIADFGQAIQIDPKDANAYRDRGRLFFYNGDFERAAGDLLRANDLAVGAHTMLWRYLARGRLKQDGTVELGANAARLKSKDWPFPVIEFYLGRRTLAEMRGAAAKLDDKCGAEFYAGEWHLLRGNTSGATAALKIAVETCPKRLIEYAGAIAELKRLKP